MKKPIFLFALWGLASSVQAFEGYYAGYDTAFNTTQIRGVAQTAKHMTHQVHIGKLWEQSERLQSGFEGTVVMLPESVSDRGQAPNDRVSIWGFNLTSRIDYKLHPRMHPSFGFGYAYRYNRHHQQKSSFSLTTSQDTFYPFGQIGVGINLIDKAQLRVTSTYEFNRFEALNSEYIKYTIGLSYLL